MFINITNAKSTSKILNALASKKLQKWQNCTKVIKNNQINYSNINAYDGKSILISNFMVYLSHNSVSPSVCYNPGEYEKLAILINTTNDNRQGAVRLFKIPVYNAKCLI